jgi:hypothetical protein
MGSKLMRATRLQQEQVRAQELAVLVRVEVLANDLDAVVQALHKHLEGLGLEHSVNIQ